MIIIYFHASIQYENTMRLPASIISCVMFATLSLAQTPGHVVHSELFTGHDQRSEFIGISDAMVFLTRNAKVKGGLVGVLEGYRRTDLALVGQKPLALPLEDADVYVRVGGLMVQGAPGIIYSYNKKGKGRAVDLAILDPATGEVSSHQNLMTVPGGKEQYSGEVLFMQDETTGRAVVLVQKQVGSDGLLYSSTCQVVAVGADGLVGGPVEFKLGEGGYSKAVAIAVTGEGKVVVHGRERSAVQSADKGPCMAVVDLASGTATALTVPDGRDQGGVCDAGATVVLTRLPDGRVALHQPYTKKGVPGYGFSGLMTTMLSAAGELEGHTLHRLGTRDVVKHDTKLGPYLVGMGIQAHWVSDSGTWMFLMRRKLSGEGAGELAILELDPAGEKVQGWFLRREHRMLVVLDTYIEVVAVPGPGKTCWLLMTELSENVGKAPGKDLAEWSTAKVFGGDLAPCLVRFDGADFGPITALEGLDGKFTTPHALHRDPVTGGVLVQWLHGQRVAFSEVGR